MLTHQDTTAAQSAPTPWEAYALKVEGPTADLRSERAARAKGAGACASKLLTRSGESRWDRYVKHCGTLVTAWAGGIAGATQTNCKDRTCPHCRRIKRWKDGKMLEAEVEALGGHYVHVILTQKRVVGESACSAVDRHRQSWKGMTRGCRTYRRIGKRGVSLVRSLHLEAHENPSVTSWHAHTHVLLQGDDFMQLLEGVVDLMESWLKNSEGAKVDHQRVVKVKDAGHLSALCAYLPEKWEYPSASRELEAHQALNGIRMWSATGCFSGWRKRRKKSYEPMVTGAALHRVGDDHEAVQGLKAMQGKLLKPRELDAEGNPIGELPAHFNEDGERFDPLTGEVLEDQKEETSRQKCQPTLIPVSLPTLSPNLSTWPAQRFAWVDRPSTRQKLWPLGRGPPSKTLCRGPPHQKLAFV